MKRTKEKPPKESREKASAKSEKETREALPAKVDVETLAALLGLDPRRVQQLRKEGVIPSAGRAQYDLVGSVQGYIKYWRDRAEGRVEKEKNDPKRGDWMTRKIAGEAEKLEYFVAEKRRSLVSVNYMRDQWHHGLALIRAALMSLPGRAAQPLGACENSTERELFLEEEVRRTMEAVQELGADPKFDDDDEDAAA